MKSHFLPFLRCPSCKGGLQFTPLNAGQQDAQTEFTEGKLTCACGGAYPVIGGVPRLLPPAFAPSLKTFYKGFFSEHGRHFPEIASSGVAPSENSYALKIKQEVIKNFGYEWRTFSDYDLNNYDVLFHPQNPSMLKDKLVLDAGCGAGRHAKRSAGAGAKVIGMDLSTAVDAAHENTKSNPDICIIQADICNPPFEKNTFDFIYSFGVLHHLPQPSEGFSALSRLLKANGNMMIWVYSSERKRSRRIIELLRKATTKMPERPLQGFSFLCALFDYYLLINPYKIAAKNKRLETFLKPRVSSRVVDYAKYDFHVTVVDWFDRLAAPVSHYHSREELEAWYGKAGFAEFSVTPTEDWGWKGFGKHE